MAETIGSVASALIINRDKNIDNVVKNGWQNLLRHSLAKGFNEVN